MKCCSVIFGGAGQDGIFLRDLLLSVGHQVYSFTHHGGPVGPPLDVADFYSVETVIKERRPDMIFHLAARSSTRHEDIIENHRAIVEGALAVLESADRHVPNSKIFIASSALVFKNIGLPIKEDDELITNTAYAMARAEALQIARYFRHRGRRVYVGFLFNHESHLRPLNSVAKKVAANVLAISQGLQKTLIIGNASVVKEWTWAGDTVRAILDFVNQDYFFELCIGSGIGETVMNYASACCKIVGVSPTMHLIEDPNYEADYISLISDSSKIRSLGWLPRVDLDGLALLMINAEISRNKMLVS